MPLFLPADEPAALFAQNRFADAINAARKSGESQVLIRALLRLDRWDEALGEAEEAVRAHPADADLLGLLALAQFRAGRPDEALKSARAARKLAPESYFALVSEATLLSAWLDDEKAALPLARKATTLRPDRPEGWWTLLHALDGPKDAPSVIARLQALKPKGHPFDEQLSDLGALNDTMEALERNRKRLESKSATSFPDMARLPITRELGMVFVETTINGKKVKLLFDTGASNALVLDEAVAKTVRPTFLSKTIVRGVQGKAASRLLVAERVSIGDVKLGRVPFREVADTPMCDGIFGGALLDRYAVTLDFARGELISAPREKGKARGKSPADPRGARAGEVLLDAVSSVLGEPLRPAEARRRADHRADVLPRRAALGDPRHGRADGHDLPAPRGRAGDGRPHRAGAHDLHRRGGRSRDKQHEDGDDDGAASALPHVRGRLDTARCLWHRRVPARQDHQPRHELRDRRDPRNAVLLVVPPRHVRLPEQKADPRNGRSQDRARSRKPRPKRDSSKVPTEAAGDGKAWVFVTSAGSWVKMGAGSLPKGALAAPPFATPPGYRAVKLDKADWALVPR